MSKTRLVMNVIGSALLLGAMVTVSEATGTEGRDFISTNGTDTGTCAVAAPCRTISFALTQLANNGELVFLTSGGYGPATITQGVTLSAEGVHASISAPTGSGLTINAPSQTVTIRGLSILSDGLFNSVDGITVNSVGTLYLQGLTIEGFGNEGVTMAGGSLFMQDSDVRACQVGGLDVFNTGTTAYVKNSNFSFCSAGLEADDGTSVTAAGCSANYNEGGFACNAKTTANSLVLINDTAMENFAYGVEATGSFAVITLDGMLITQNFIGVELMQGATAVTGTSPGTSLIVGNTMMQVSGTLGTANVLQ